MCTFNKPLAYVLLTFAAFAVLHAAEEANVASRRACTRCNLAFRCDPYYSGPPVWAVVDGACRLFKTDCLFASANCQRQNECLPKLVKTSQQLCQEHCITSCADVPISPVRAVFPYVTNSGDNHDSEMIFVSQCELDMWSCWNAKAFLYSAPN